MSPPQAGRAADPHWLHPCGDGESVTKVLDREFESDGCYSGVKPHVAFSKPPFPMVTRKMPPSREQEHLSSEPCMKLSNLD